MGACPSLGTLMDQQHQTKLVVVYVKNKVSQLVYLRQFLGQFKQCNTTSSSGLHILQGNLELQPTCSLIYKFRNSEPPQAKLSPTSVALNYTSVHHTHSHHHSLTSKGTILHTGFLCVFHILDILLHCFGHLFVIRFIMCSCCLV